MSSKIVELDCRKPGQPSKPVLPTLYLGRQYLIEDDAPAGLTPIHGLAGGYRLSAERAEVLPVATRDGRGACFFWDTDASLPPSARPLGRDDGRLLDRHVLQGNSVQVTGGGMHGPEVLASGDETVLTLSPRFELAFHTDAYGATLGVIHLVQARRFITLDDGSEIVLLDTHDQEGPVLYLENADDHQPVKPVLERQGAGEARTCEYGLEVSQAIPDEVHGRTVETVTVLEQYSSYFMQRELDQPEDECIWTPTCAPIAWGWSIRVGRRVDGPWGIVRRKLMLPIPGHDGLELPVWAANSLTC